MPHPSHRFTSVGIAVLAALYALMITVVVPPLARAAPSVTTHTVIITQQGTVFNLNPCATKPDGTPFLLQPGDLLAFENHTSGAVQILQKRARKPLIFSQGMNGSTGTLDRNVCS